MSLFLLRQPDAREQIVRLAERLEAPLAATLKAKGLFKGHPCSMDIFGTLSTPAAYELIARTDCLICFGAGLHHFTTDKGGPAGGKSRYSDRRGLGQHHTIHAVFPTTTRIPERSTYGCDALEAECRSLMVVVLTSCLAISRQLL